MTCDHKQVHVAKQQLQSLPTEVAYSDLVALTRDSDPCVRGYALRLTTELFPDKTESVAIPLLGDPVGFVRWHACYYLCGRHCYHAAEQVAQLLAHDPDELVRFMAAFLLGDCGNPSLLPILYNAAETDTGRNHEGTPIQEPINKAIRAILARAETTDPGE